MVGKLNRLPLETQKALQQLACLGNSSEFTTLSIVHGKSEDELHSDLWEAMRLEYVVRVEGLCKFAHDRVQEAAYSLIPEQLRAEAHLRIGRLLNAHTPLEKREEAIFEIVNQLNRGAALITSREERDQIAELNLIAGRRAKASTAYISALNYLTAGVSLLAEDSWERRHELIFALELHTSECEFLTGELAAAAERLATLSSRAANTVELATVACSRIDVYTALEQSDLAVAVCLDYLRHLGVDWSPELTDEEARGEYERIWINLGNRTIEELIDLPLMSDPVSLATLDVLTKVLPPALHASQANLLSMTACRAVNLSLERGHGDGSCVAYEFFGRIAGPQFGDYKAGFQFGQLGYELVEKRGLERFQARTYHWFAQFVVPWTKHVRACRDLMRRAFEAATKIGDLTLAAYSCDNLNTNLLAAGDPLAKAQRRAEHGLEFAKKARFGLIIDIIKAQIGLIRTLRGLTPKFGSFDDGEFDELCFEGHFANRPAPAVSECGYWIRKLQARFLAGDYPSAIYASSRAQRVLWTSTAVFEAAEYEFYGALSQAASCDSAAGAQRQQHFDALATHHRQLRLFAENCPENFENRAALVGAEIARIEGRTLDAESLYEQAIRSAHANGFVHNEALANELTARFYATRGFTKIAHAYLRDARYCYLCWGAAGKVRQLDELYPVLLEGEAVPRSTSIIGAPVEHLDLATVIKVSQAVSSEIDLGKLIEKLMTIAVEHAGAERGLLFLPHDHEHRIAAAATTHDDKVQVMLGPEFADFAKFPESIFRYVIRTRESVILNDASVQNLFSADEYLRGRQSKSILCTPLLKQGELTGVLYLENNLAPRAFTPDRLALLELLASQAAISLESARLYADLRQENCDRSKAEEALRASEERMNLAAEAANLAMWEWDVGKDEIWMTDKGRALYGLVRDARLDYAALVSRVHPDDRVCRDAAIRRALEAEGEYATEYRIVGPDGQVRWIAGRGRVDFCGGKPLRMRGVSLDITERRQAELEAARQRTDLAHAARVTIVGELTASIAHEINQPLGAILSNAETAVILLESKQPQLAEVRQILAEIRQDDLRASEVIRRLRELLRKHELELKLIDLNAVTSNVLRLVDAETRRRGVEIKKQFADTLPVVRGDVIHLQQVLLNLILNGMEAMSESSESNRRLTMRTGYDGKGNVEVAVEDSGPGISPDHLPRLFDSFFTTKTHGMGLGLSIVRSIVEAHGGRIWAENNSSGGACFRFTLPVNGEA
jgi:signal transduction histidine kinase/GAF domain-containing protein